MNAKYVLIILLAFAICNVKAQEKTYLDTIKISVDNKVFITIATVSYRDLLKDSTILKDISVFQTSISKTKSEIPEYKIYKIEYVPGRSMVIKEGENKKSYYVKDGTIEPNIFISECFISGDDYKMRINFADINDLEKVDMKEKVKQTLLQMPKKDRIASTFNYSIKDTTFMHLRELDKKNGALDVLEINVSIGAGLIKNQLFNNFTSTFGIILPKNGILKYNWYASARGFVTFDENDNLKMNSFVTIGFRVNTSKVVDRKNWMGLEVGRIIKNEGNIFGKDTYMLGTIKDFGKLTLSTELYFYDKFNKFYPGLRVEFNL